MDERTVTSLLLVVTFCACFQASVAQWTRQLSAYEIASFQNPDPDHNTKLNHVLFHGPSDVYVGAVNSIYRLDENFVVQSNASTALDCEDPDDCANENKILFVEPLRDRLITCWSDNGGRCQQRSRDELTVAGTENSVVGVSPGRGKTTVGLLAPGPGRRDWLYVASTYTRDSNTDVPAVARRRLGLEVPDGRLFFSGEDVQINFNSDYKSRAFDINYVYGFSTNGFTYFVTAQQKTTSFTPIFVSKVVRVCQNSNTFESYTEIVLRCGQESQSYNLAQAAYFGQAGPDLAESLGIQEASPMLFAVFATNVGASDTPSDSSALCAFRMDEIEEAFATGIRKCIQNGVEYKVGYLDRSKCNSIPTFTDSQLQTVLCDVRQNIYRNANNPDGVTATPLFRVEDARMSSIITSTETNHTVAFIGTSQGSLIKVHIENGTHARLYETIKVGDSAVQTDISLDETKQQLRLLTEQQLLRLRVENCSQYTSCESCIGGSSGQDGDPYCGWCTLQNKCTVHRECPMADISTRWLPYNAIQCVDISDIEPANLPITDPQQMITLTIDQLPDLEAGESYSCQFNNLPLSPGETTGNIIRCMTPLPSTVPLIRQMEDHVTLELSVFSSVSDMKFISSTFSFYDCTGHTSCTACVSIPWNCDWCIYDNICTHLSAECTEGDYIITGNNNPDTSSVRGPDFCPQLQPQTQEVLVPVGIPIEIQVPASNLPNATQVTEDYQCLLLVEGTRQIVSASVIQPGVIQCHSQMYSYAANDREMEVQLSISWNVDRQLDDSTGFTVTLYKCDVDRQDCSRCLSNETARPELECRWCGSQCAFRDDAMCSSGARDPSDSCPAPALQKVEPATGPIEGNTVIEITGTNIGRRFEDVRSVMIGQQSCDLTGLGDQYITGRSVRCRTTAMSLGDSQPITVSVAPVAPPDSTDLTSTGDVMFTYTDPMITSFSPSVGPADGGTVVTIEGTDLNTGRDIQAMVADDVTCRIDRESLSKEAVVCRTTNSYVGDAGRVFLTFDSAQRRSEAEFTYKPNPNITDINPRRSVMSGGRTVYVTGRNFLQIQTPQIISTLETDGNTTLTFQKPCQAISDTNMTCETPDLSSALSYGVRLSGRSKRQTAPSPIIGFIMADVASLLRWSENQAPPGFQFEFVPDPVFDRFIGDGNILELDGTKITIRGSDLDNAQTSTEVRVFIGTQKCSVEVFDSSILTCEAPELEPEPLDYQGNRTSVELPAVYVLHSRRYFFIGYVRYITSVEIALYIGIAAAAVALALVALALFLYRKLRGKQKEIGDMLIKMEKVEQAEDLRMENTTSESDGQQLELPTSAGTSAANVHQPYPGIAAEDAQIKFSQLQMGDKLGQGAFGTVYRAVLNNWSSGEQRIVAVKTVEDPDPPKVVQFLKEGLSMKSFNHPNVLKLLGLTFDRSGQPLIVIPFMANGDLKSFLVKQKQNLTHTHLTMFAYHVALGMEYLAEQQFVHRDLAARNCLVDDKLVAKIADFGLSRDLDESDYYTSGEKQAKLPIKWMAPESMERKVYDTKTDVWSYGVLLWELFSRGRTPYPDIHNRDVHSYLKQGQRMNPPRFCPTKISAIMRHCWLDSAKKRWSFGQIVQELEPLVTHA
ncbi:plexin-A4-like [Patiria miniata]|uniref:Hepatocyte growth factor receptor n=1 Tax=Patiria miniata TaxID=46514 RepID=A0A914ASV3_PATMI|nr:plexin-A4-like [Patiria miniata]